MWMTFRVLALRQIKVTNSNNNHDQTDLKLCKIHFAVFDVVAYIVIRSFKEAR